MEYKFHPWVRRIGTIIANKFLPWVGRTGIRISYKFNCNQTGIGSFFYSYSFYCFLLKLCEFCDIPLIPKRYNTWTFLNMNMTPWPLWLGVPEDPLAAIYVKFLPGWMRVKSFIIDVFWIFFILAGYLSGFALGIFIGNHCPTFIFNIYTHTQTDEETFYIRLYYHL